MEDNWYILRDGKRHAPYSGADLKKYATYGHLLPMDLVVKGKREKGTFWFSDKVECPLFFLIVSPLRVMQTIAADANLRLDHTLSSYRLCNFREIQ